MKIKFSKAFGFAYDICQLFDTEQELELKNGLSNLYPKEKENRTLPELLALRMCKELYNYADPDSVKGCIFGGAIGDALGYPVEFVSDIYIFSKYGEKGITNYQLYNGVALISDDTQMSLFTAMGVINAKNAFENPSEKQLINGVYNAYLRWLKTQDESFCLPESAFDYADYDLLTDSRLHSQRAPGNTCLSALYSGKTGDLTNRINESKGCGGIMRIAPLAVYLSQTERSCKEVAIACAKAGALTHGHDLGFMPCAFLGAILYFIFKGENIINAYYNAKEQLKMLFSGENMQYLLNLCDKAVSFALENDGFESSDLECISALGEGWVAEETLAISLYCALKYSDSFEKGVVASVNHSGDSDSTGAVTGNILGAYLGYSQIPEKYKNNLELSDILTEVSEKLQLHELVD